MVLDIERGFLELSENIIHAQKSNKNIQNSLFDSIFEVQAIKITGQKLQNLLIKLYISIFNLLCINF